MSKLWRALVWCDRSLSRGAATPETDVLAASRSLATVSLAERADLVDRLLEERCLRAEVGIIEAPVPVP